MALDPLPTPPAKRGFKLFFTVFFRELPGLVGLNLIFLLSCLPVVTLGPALSALGQVLGQMADDQPTEPVRDYFSAFRTDFLRKLGWGMALFAAAGVLGISAWFYAFLGLLPLTGVSLAGLLCQCGIALHLLPALSDPVPPSHPLSAAASAALSSFWRTTLSLLSALAFLVLQVLLFPASFPFTFLVGLVLPGLALAFPRLPR